MKPKTPRKRGFIPFALSLSKGTLNRTAGWSGFRQACPELRRRAQSERCELFRVSRTALWLLPLGLAACAVGPQYRAPEAVTGVPAQFANAQPAGNVQAMPEAWWTLFKDPAIDRLVRDALTRSPDLATAQASIRQARAAVDAVAGTRMPQVNAGARIGHDQLSRNSENFANVPFPNPKTGFTDYRLGFDASWEIDLFGHTAHGIEAAQARFEGVEEERRDIALRVAAEVTRNVVDYRALRQRLANAESMRGNSRELLRLVQLQRQAGVVADAELARAQGAVHDAEAQLPPLEAAARASIAALSVLVDQPYDDVAAVLQSSAPVPPQPELAATLMPSELLKRRPDVRRAERQLAAASAEVGVAVAEQYPRLSLVGSAGWDSLKVGTLTDSASRYWSLGPQLSLPLFNGGRLQANVAGREAARDAALAGYRKAVLAALADVETALIRYRQEQKRLVELEQSKQNRQRQADIAERRYRVGETSALEWIEARQQLAALEDLRLASMQQAANNAAALFKALGGGVGGE